MSLWKLPQVYGQPPSARWGHTTTVFKQNKQLLVIGGWDGMRMLNDSFVLDLDFMAWTKVEISGDAPCARAGHSMSFVNENKIILFGGGDGSNYLNDLYVFDGETMTWSKPETKGKPPAPRSRHTATVVGNKLFIMGGGSNSRIFDDLYILDTDTMEWSQPETKGESPIPRWGHTCTLIKDKLYVFGGVVNGRMLNELFTLDTATLEYKRVDTEYLPAPRAGHSCISYADRYLFVLWGGDDKSFLNDLYIIDTEKLTGARMKFTTPKPRCAHSCTIVGENVYAYGGGDGTTRFKELYTLNAAKAIEKSGIKNITRPASSMVGSSSASAPAVTTPSADEQKSDSTNANNNNNSSSSSSSSTARSPVKSEKQEVAKLATDDNANATLSKPTIDERDAGISPLRSAEHLEKRRRGSKIHAKSSSRSISDDFALQQQQQQQQQQQEQQQGLYNQEEAYGHIIHHTYGQKEAEEITRWLDGIGLVKYAGLFIREEVDLDTLPLLREHDLIRMGVAALGPRKKILLGIANLARLRGTATTTTTTTTSSSLVSVLEETSAAALATELSFINHSISNLARSMEQLQESIKTLSVVYSINNNNNSSSSSPSRNIPILAGGHPFAPSAYMAPARRHHHHQVVHAHQYYANATTHQEQAEAEGEEQHKQQQIVDQEAAQCQLQQQQEQAEQQRQQQEEEERDFINELANKNKGNLSSSSNNNSISRHDASGRPDEHHEGSIDNEADVSTAEDTKPENEIVEYDREDVAAANNAAVAGKGDDDAVEAEEVAVPDAQMLRVDDGATDGLLESGASGAGEQVDHHDGEHQQQQGQHLYFHHEAAMDNEHPHEDDEAAAATAAAMAMAIQQQQQQYHQQYHHHHHRHQQQQQQELANSPYYLYYQHHLQQQQQQQPTSPYYYYRMHPHPVSPACSQVESAAWPQLASSTAF